MSGLSDHLAAERQRLAELEASRQTPEAIAAREAQERAEAADAARTAEAPSRLAQLVNEFSAEMDALKESGKHWFEYETVLHPHYPSDSKSWGRTLASKFVRDLGEGWEFGHGQESFSSYSRDTYFPKWVALRSGHLIIQTGRISEVRSSFHAPPSRPFWKPFGWVYGTVSDTDALFDAPAWALESESMGIERPAISDGIVGLRDDNSPSKSLEEAMASRIASVELTVRSSSES